MQYASRKYLKFLDADDYLKKDMLEKMYHTAEAGCSDIVICRYGEHCERTGKLRDTDWAYADYFLETRSEFTGVLLKHAGIFQAVAYKALEGTLSEKGWGFPFLGEKLMDSQFCKQVIWVDRYFEQYKGGRRTGGWF